MKKYRIVLDTVFQGAIIDDTTNNLVAYITTKRPDLGFEELQKLVDLANEADNSLLTGKQREVLDYLKLTDKYRKDPINTIAIFQLNFDKYLCGEIPAGGITVRKICEIWDGLIYPKRVEVVQKFLSEVD